MVKPNVVIFGMQTDPHVDIVQRKLIRSGIACSVIDIDTLVEHGFCFTPTANTFKTREGKQIYDLQDVAAFWVRKIDLPDFFSSTLTQSQKSFISKQWNETLYGLYMSLEKKFWISNPDKMRKAGNKLYQLTVASKYFNVPNTLLTNSPTKALTFCKRNPQTIIKTVASGEFEKGDSKSFAIPTSRIKPSTIEKKFAGLEKTPVILQKEIKRLRDLRVYIVGNEIIAASIRARCQTDYIDVRQLEPKDTLVEKFQLPIKYHNRCIRLVYELGLNYAVIDMIEDVESNIWFLELNPLGQFVWIEEAARVDISGAIALTLTREAKNLKS